jgi:hypothetical protein
VLHTGTKKMMNSTNDGNDRCHAAAARLRTQASFNYYVAALEHGVDFISQIDGAVEALLKRATNESYVHHYPSDFVTTLLSETSEWASEWVKNGWVRG